MAHYPYPPDFPAQDVVELVIAFVNGQGDLKEGAHAAWHVAGYLLSMWDQHPQPYYGAGPFSRAEALAALEVLKSPPPAEGGTFQALPPLPWKLLAGLLLEMVANWLKNR